MRGGRGGHGREERRRQGGAEAQRGHQRDGELRDVAQQREGQDRDDTERADHRHEGAEGGEPVGGAAEEDVAPDDRRGQAGGQADAAGPAVTALPEPHGGDADERAERRGEGDGVVGVDDALGQADDEPDAHERAAPQQERGAFAIGATGPDGDDEQDGAHHQRAGQQPRHHVAELGVEEAGDAGRAPHAAGDPTAADAARLAAR